MSFVHPEYEFRTYYVFHKTTGRIVYSHRFMTLMGDDSVLKRVSEESLIADAAAHSGHAASDLGVHVELGPRQTKGYIAGYDLAAKALIVQPRPNLA